MEAKKKVMNDELTSADTFGLPDYLEKKSDEVQMSVFLKASMIMPYDPSWNYDQWIDSWVIRKKDISTVM